MKHHNPAAPRWHERLSVAVIEARGAAGRWLRPFLRPGVLGVGLVAATYSASQLLKSQDVPSHDAWTDGHPLNIVLLASGVFTLLAGALVLYGYSRLLKKEEKSDELAETCKGVWHIAIETLGIPREQMDKVGVHVWVVRGVWGARYLERRATFTLEPRRVTQILWRKGKGAIGVAWAENDPKIATVGEGAAAAATKADFDRLTLEERFGLTWDEFKESKHYRAILAVPLRTRPGHVAGCLSVDVQLDGYDQKLETLASAGQLSNAVATCESVLRGGA